jgi:hypothetical protein
MKVKEIKEEKVVATKYIAEDGSVFWDEEECRKYEESALFVLSQDLKMKAFYKSECMIDGADEEYVRVFEVPTEKELEKLKRYLYLKATDGINLSGDLSNLTYGCKIITFWNWEDDYCWTLGDGSLEAYVNYAKEQMEEAITKAYSDNKED